MRIKTLLPLLLVFTFSFGQKSKYKAFQQRDIDTNYIVDHSEKFLFKLYGINKTNEISQVDNVSGKSINYKPNEGFSQGFGISYKWFGIDIAFDLANRNKDSDVYGFTKRFDFQSTVYLRNLVTDLNIQSYKGYYITNPWDYQTGFDPEKPVYPIRPDMSTLNIGVNSLYVFKHDKFSFRSAYVYNERQIKSAGSFVTGAYFGYFKLDADSNIIPQAFQDSIGNVVDFRGTNFTSAGISGGYAHTFVMWKKVFLSLNFILGLGPEVRTIPKSEDQKSSSVTKLGNRVFIRAALGYNSDRFFMGITGVSQSTSSEEYKTALEYQVSNFKVFMGLRFSPPRFLKKLM